MVTTPGSIATRTWVTGREQARLKGLATKWATTPDDLTPKELDKLAVLLALWARSHDVCTYDGLNIETVIADIRSLQDEPPRALTTTERTERFRRRQGAQPKTVARHGTTGGYKRHLREGGDACGHCKEANADRSKVVAGTMDAETAEIREAGRLAELRDRATDWSDT